jgi:signal transduction histidine kinase
MRVPSFVAEMELPSQRGRLWASVASGYATALGFLLLALVAHATHVVPFRRGFAAVLVLKLSTNSLVWLSLRRGRLVLWAAGANIVADLVAMTAVIDFTGGELSPLFPIYAIEITVLALLGNVGLAVTGAALAVLLYSTMAILVGAGWLASYPPPAVTAGGLTPAYTAVDVVYAAFVIGVPTFYTARILEDLRAKSRALEARTAALIEAGRQKSQFLANVSHELRTPIHGISGLCDLMESGVYGPLGPKQREAQSNIRRSAQTLLGLIDDLLELSRADAGKLALRPEPVDLAELLPTVHAAVVWMLGTKHLSLRLDVSSDLPVIETDPRKLNQVLINLLSNAVKFTPEGGTVALVAERAGDDAVRIAVIDSGVGIDPVDHERIFEEFRQLDGSFERAYGGVGLGLALVRRLATALGARVGVASRPGEGATFEVTVPVSWRGAARAAA